MTIGEIKKYLEDRNLVVVSDDEDDLLLDDVIIATFTRAYLKIIRNATVFRTSADGVDMELVTEKDLDKFISARASWLKNYDRRIRRERISAFRKAVEEHRGKQL